MNGKLELVGKGESSTVKPAYDAAGTGALRRFVEMPKTISGEPRYSSRSDGEEAGIVAGGFIPRGNE